MKKEFKDICKACGMCDGTSCAALQRDIKDTGVLPEVIPQNYGGGIRFTSDAADCALPISIDGHNGCSYSCLYCFAFSLMRAPDRNAAILKRSIKQGSFYGQFPIKRLESFLNREPNNMYNAMYPLLNSGLPVQLGALGDPFDDLEGVSGWTKEALKLFIKYDIPVRVSTKGAKNLQKKEYLKIIEKKPELFWFAFSIICNDDKRMSKIDINAPVTSERLKAMKAVTDMGCWASLRFRPFIPGLSDAYKGEPEAWRVLLERCREAGAMATSFEYIFLEAAPTPRQREMYRLMFRQIQNPDFGKEWKAMSDSRESCLRGTRIYKYEMTTKIRDRCHELGMVFGISDPHFKEFNDYGCCCGIADNHPTHGRWSRRQLTNVVVELKRAYDRGERKRVTYLDWAPQWAHEQKAGSIISFKDAHGHRQRRHQTFGDTLRNKFNNPKHPRSPFIYFEGVMRPVGVDKNTGDVVYEYRDWDKKVSRDQIELISPKEETEK